MHSGMTGEGIATQLSIHKASGKHIAFSLVELSIVLVILGLLIGGVLSGQSLIRAAELRSVNTEYSKYLTAVSSFRDKYFAIPGDMNNATSFWGAAHATPATCLTTPGTGTQTCNGDGGGTLLITCPGTSQYCEAYTFWQHLANAGLIEGTYTGMSTTVTATHMNTTNSPTSKLSSSLWMVNNDATSGGGFFPEAVARHNFRLGKMTSTGWPSGKLFTPAEMWGIDTKLDDGKPGTGKVTGTLSTYVTLPDCATTAVASTAEYELSIPSAECVGTFAAGF